MKPNIVLMEKALDDLRLSPAEWAQHSWRCGTRMCYAGFVAFAAGARWKYRWERVSCADEKNPEMVVITPNGREMEVDDYALEVLGVDEDGRVLFDGPNTIQDLARIIDRFRRQRLAGMFGVRNEGKENGKVDVRGYEQ